MHIASSSDNEKSSKALEAIENLTPREVVTELDKFIVGQSKAKRAVAVALRNRYRRFRLAEDMRDEVIPKNILMIGPTGVGKTEIARRLANLARAPFLKIEATKFTEVGYVGRDVDSIVRDIVQISVRLVEAEMMEAVQDKADAVAVDRIVDILQPRRGRVATAAGRAAAGAQDQLAEFQQQMGRFFGFTPPTPTPPGQMPNSMPRVDASSPGSVSPAAPTDDEYERKRAEQEERIRERLREQVASGARDAEEVEIEVEESAQAPFLPMLGGPGGGEEMGREIGDFFGQMLPRKKKQRRVPIGEARRLLSAEAARSLIDQEAVTREAVERAEQSGVIFIDEIDKVAGRGGDSGRGPDVSREGVQRDLLPIIEGSTVQTRYGPVSTNHMLFIAAGAFHVSKPSDLIPELQGRLPIRVELDSLNEEDFRRILTEPKNALTKQYAALLATEGITINFTDESIHEIARIAVDVNTRTENIGARRLHTVMERLLEEVSFDAPDVEDPNLTVDAAFVRERLAEVAKDEDLSRYIL